MSVFSHVTFTTTTSQYIKRNITHLSPSSIVRDAAAQHARQAGVGDEVGNDAQKGDYRRRRKAHRHKGRHLWAFRK